uniref:Uncharacterized protein n=1 Tax=Cacopsylla melanoneura TaxID=428564 RepID=A0A8D8ZY85_9HEMI
MISGGDGGGDIFSDLITQGFSSPLSSLLVYICSLSITSILLSVVSISSSVVSVISSRSADMFVIASKSFESSASRWFGGELDPPLFPGEEDRSICFFRFILTSVSASEGFESSGEDGGEGELLSSFFARDADVTVSLLLLLRVAVLFAKGNVSKIEGTAYSLAFKQSKEFL